MMKVTAVSLLLLGTFQCTHGFSQIPSAATSQAQGPVQVKDWNKQVSEPPAQGGRRYGPNWTIDPDTLGPKQVDQKTGAMVWAIGDSKFEHPEQRSDLPVGKWLQTRPKLGICMSGGGTRAATCALGWYRALHHLDLLTKARYLGANSGATWTTLPLFCRQMLQKKDDDIDIDYAEFVGKYLEPEDIVFDKEPIGAIGKVLEESDFLKYQRDTEKVSFDAWTDAVDREYVEPLMDTWKKDKNWRNDFWLELSDAYLWNTAGTKEILNKNSFPFPIFVATVYDEDNDQESFPLENTPLYSGIPMDPRNLGADFGGGFVQGVALNSKGLEDSSPVPCDPENLYFKEFDNPSPVVKVAELTSASSSAVASLDAATRVDLKNPVIRGIVRAAIPVANNFLPTNVKGSDVVNYLEPGKYKWWSPTTGGDPVELAFVDGGLYDNLGALAVLRREVSTVIICYACSHNLLETSDEDVKKDYCDVGFLFGEGEMGLGVPEVFVKKRYNSESLNERSQVFENGGFMDLINEMRALQRKGKPLVVRKKLGLLENKLAGIRGAREVDVIFCFNGEVKDFDDRAKIPECANINKSFPYASTLQASYNVEEVNMLSSLSGYSLVEGLKNVNFDIDQVETLSP